MRVRSRAAPLLPWFALWAAACHVAEPPRVATGDVVPQALLAAEFPAAKALLAGYVDGSADATWQVGDAVLYGLRLQRDGVEQRWLLSLVVDELAPPVPPRVWTFEVDGTDQRFESSLCRVTACVYDGDGRELARSQPLVPQQFLARGFASVCATTWAARRAGGKPPAARDVAAGVVSAVALLETVRQDRALAPVLWAVVDKPSLWSVIGNLGATVLVRPHLDRFVPCATPNPAMPFGSAWRVPMSLFVNDQPALEAELVVADSTPPFAVGAGVLAAVARHPTRPDVRCEMLLLGAGRTAAR
jgi:hypothetical protein